MEVGGQVYAPATLPSKGKTLVPLVQEAVWTPEPVWTLWRRKSLLFLPRIKPRLLGRPTRSLIFIATEVEFLKYHILMKLHKALKNDILSHNSDNRRSCCCAAGLTAK
jgi:hypothetical protein